MIKAIIFDCFGVLTGDLWKEFLASIPEKLRPEARDLNHALDRGFITQADFFESVHRLTGMTPKRVEEMINSDMAKNQTLLEYIAVLKPKYKISILSNVSTNWIRTNFLSKTEQLLFDDFLLSYETGLIKPEPQIFELAAKRLNCQVEECIFIDDGPGNVQAAQDQGMQAIVYENFVQLKQDLEKLLASN